MRLVEAISLVECVKSVFSAVNCQIFLVKMSENHTSLVFLRGGTLILSYSGVSDVLVRHLLSHHYFGFCGSRECRRPTVDVDTIVMCIVDLGVTKESKTELGVVCDLSTPAVWLLCCPRNPFITQAWLFIAF